ncbi:hypothetical protein DFH27DRAFT_278082 [Peziza echinospora]|nr:hypothetical protein DFH27DRAFT_278082 [Peziza echinospora]
MLRRLVRITVGPLIFNTAPPLRQPSLQRALGTKQPPQKPSHKKRKTPTKDKASRKSTQQIMPPRRELPTRTRPPPAAESNAGSEYRPPPQHDRRRKPQPAAAAQRPQPATAAQRPPPPRPPPPPVEENYGSGLPKVELTLRDFFRHFPSFDLRPALQTHEERLALARAVAEQPRSQTFEALPAALARQIKHAEEQFEKLAALKGWRPDGDSHSREMYGTHHRTFRQALNTTCARMAEWAHTELEDLRRRRTAGFFGAIEVACAEYEHDPSLPPSEELERAARVAGWSDKQKQSQRSRLGDILADRDPEHRAAAGTARIEQLALDKADALARFFALAEKEAEAVVPAYRYNRNAYPPVEFARLSRLMGEAGRWKEERKKKMRQEFGRIYGFADPWQAYGLLETNTPIGGGRLKAALKGAVDMDKSPMALFCRSFNNHRYRYTEQTPTEEFGLIENMVRDATGYNYIARQWSLLIPESEFEQDEEKRSWGILPYWKSEVHFELQNRFYRAVENHFDWLVDLQCRDTGLSRDEYVALFFGVNTQGKKGEDYNKAFATLYINIYDFIDHLHELQMMTKRNLEQILNRKAPEYIPPADQDPEFRPVITPTVPTKFPTERHLGIYCERTGRIFNSTAAHASGTLARLLKLVGLYFDYPAKSGYCADLDKEFMQTKKLAEVDAMILRLIGRGYRGPLFKYFPERGIKVTIGEPSLIAKYPRLFESVRETPN